MTSVCLWVYILDVDKGVLVVILLLYLVLYEHVNAICRCQSRCAKSPLPHQPAAVRTREASTTNQWRRPHGPASKNFPTLFVVIYLFCEKSRKTLRECTTTSPWRGGTRSCSHCCLSCQHERVLTRNCSSR